jgi:hypothetical protein
MLKKRLLVLTVMLCSLAFVASESAGTAKAGAWCSCAAISCNTCDYQCDPDPGTTQAQVDAAALSCCQQAIQGMRDNPAVACGPGGVSQ